MCGIAGIMLFPKARGSYELEYIRQLATQLALEIEVRGRDATGFAVFNGKDNNKIFKFPMKASELTATSTFERFLRNEVNNLTKNILIHTRLGTKGSEFINDNNHPIETNRYIGIHNGMIGNDDKLFRERQLFRQAEVDSEVIFRLLDAEGEKATMSHVKSVAETISGSFAVATINKDFHNEVFFIKHSNPLSMAYLPEFNIILFASGETYIKNAINSTNLAFNYQQFVSIDDCKFLDAKENTVMKFDVDVDNPEIQLGQEVITFSPSYDYDYGYSYGYGYGSRFFDDEYYLGERQAKKDEQTRKPSSQFEKILEKLSDAEIEALEREFDEQKTFSWNEGYARGRESIGEEVDQAKEIKWEQGFHKGYNAGWDAGWDSCYDDIQGKEETEENTMKDEIIFLPEPTEV